MVFIIGFIHKKLISKIKNHGIDVFGLFVFGDDEFKIGDGRKVAEFVQQQGIVGVLVQPLTPFPGTRLFRKLKKEGRILHENWRDYNGKVVYRPQNLTPAELMNEIYACYRRVYSPLRLARYIISGRKGTRSGVVGEALLRYLEWRKRDTIWLEDAEFAPFITPMVLAAKLDSSKAIDILDKPEFSDIHPLSGKTLC